MRARDLVHESRSLTHRGVRRVERARAQRLLERADRYLKEEQYERACDSLLRLAEVEAMTFATIQRFNDHERLHQLAGAPQVHARMRALARSRPDSASTQLHIGAFFLDQGRLDEGVALTRAGYALIRPELVPDGTADTSESGGPTRFILGPAKAGTTSIYDWLRRQPQFVGPARKELQYWPNRRGRPVEVYRSYFPTLRPGSGLVTGEASATTLHSRDAALELSRNHADVRVIVLHRDPFDRAYSHWHMLRREAREQRSFEAAIDDELAAIGDRPPLRPEEVDWTLLDDDGSLTHPPSYGGRCPLLLGSSILPFVRMWADVLGADQVMVVDLATLAARPLDASAAIADFFGITRRDDRGIEARNQARYDAADGATERRLRPWFDPHERELERFLADGGAVVFPRRDA